MFGKSCTLLLFAGYTTLIFVVVLVLFSGNCFAKISLHCVRHSTSCGDIPKITHPFRLKGDPEKCGYEKHELSCENNRTVLYLFSGKYHVQAINYTDKTIRIVDVGIQKDNCSSLPLSSLTANNFTTYGGDAYRLLNRYYYDDDWMKRSVVVFMNCDNPVKYPIYIINMEKEEKTNYSSSRNSFCVFPKSSFSSSVAVKGQYWYAMVGDSYNLSVSDMPDLCTVEMVVMTSLPSLTTDAGANFSFLDLHNAMAYGFMLSWDVPRFYPIDVYVFLYYAQVVPIWIGLGLAGRALCGMPFFCGLLIYKFRRRHLSMFDNIEGFLQSQNNLVPIKYSYTEINKMTEGFREKLGEGGYGSVYKGKLRSGHFVAVKILDKSKANGQEFINEVATIGRIHHINVVRLIGYCVERSKRALLYDFMPNGSLEKYIFSQGGNVSLSCEQMYEISLGVARGIEYLHTGCEMQILHFDIKPHNILLDENFTPKVSDFGLSKLYSTDDSIVSLTAARGTMGYMAPELFYKNIGGVSYKADVYSFGMLLMEMAGRRRSLNVFADHTSQIYFPTWIYDQFKEGRDMEIGETSEEGRVMIKKMIIVGFWCIQMNPGDRPSMSKVVEMLEGNVELLQMPPKPSLCPQDMPTEEQEINVNPIELR